MGTLTVTLDNGKTLTGTPVEGRYPHLYVHLEVDGHVLKIPRDRLAQ